MMFFSALNIFNIEMLNISTLHNIYDFIELLSNDVPSILFLYLTSRSDLFNYNNLPFLKGKIDF